MYPAGPPEPDQEEVSSTGFPSVEGRGGGVGAGGTPGLGGGHLLLPLELAQQDEVGGRAREGGSAPNAGRVGDGDEEALPDVSAIFLLLLAVC